MKRSLFDVLLQIMYGLSRQRIISKIIPILSTQIVRNLISLVRRKTVDYFFQNNYRLKRHIRQDHKQEKLYQCQRCSRKFGSIEIRKAHVSAKHSNAPIWDNLLSYCAINENYKKTGQYVNQDEDSMCKLTMLEHYFYYLFECLLCLVK